MGFKVGANHDPEAKMHFTEMVLDHANHMGKFQPKMLDQVSNHYFEPLRVLRWFCPQAMALLSFSVLYKGPCIVLQQQPHCSTDVSFD